MKHGIATSLITGVLAALLPAALISPPVEAATVVAAAAVGSGLDVVFAIDGSGSIDADDFTTEKDSLIATLHDRRLVPVDGTTSVGIVQWAGGQTHVEIARRSLASAGDVDAVVNAVITMQQLGGGTNTGEGILAAGQLLAGGAAARQTVCVMTDGSFNIGTTPESAAASVRSNGVDRIAFATLEDRGFFGEANAHAAYDAITLDAQVVHSRSAAEYSAVLSSTCLRPSVDVVAAEVSQGTQTWNNDLPLVADRPTFVRAFVQPGTGTPDFSYGMRLRGFWAGQELAGSPLVALSSGGTVGLSSNVTSRRGDPGASFNFRLPTAWTTGQTTLELDPVGAVAGCGLRCRITAAYEVTAMPDVRFVSVPFVSGFDIRKPSAAELDEQAGQVRSAFPIASLDYDTAHFLLPAVGRPSVFSVVPRLTKGRILDGCWGGCTRLYYGVIAGDPGQGNAMGLAGDHVAAGFIGTGRPYDRNTAPHELGHVLGRPHAVRGAASGTPPIKRGVCTEQAAADAEEYPYFARIGRDEEAVLGPLDAGPQQEVWGLDIRHFPTDRTLGVVDPGKTFELMSYCGGIGQGTWTGAHTWRKLFDRLVANGSGGGGGGGGGGGWRLDAPVLAVQGTVDLKTGVVDLDPNAVVTSTYAPETPAGDWNLVLKNAAGDVQSSVPFAVTPIEAKADPGAAIADPSIGTFSVPVAYDPATTSMEIRHGSTLAASRIASAHAPTINITAPAASATLSGDVDVEWNAADEDGDALRYTVQFSSDDGQSWSTLSTFQSEKHLKVPTGVLEGTTVGAIRVLASDGFRSVADTVRFLHVPNQAPRVSILSPETGGTYTAAQTVPLSAAVRDEEDGALPAGSIVWSSDRDGVLGTGGDLNVTAASLSEGHHSVTVTATDSSGESRSASIEITVQRVEVPPNRPPAIEAIVLDPATPVAGQAATVRIAFSDPDPQAHTVRVSFGDGLRPVEVNLPPATTTAEVTHTWSSQGNYRLTALVSDGVESVQKRQPVKVSAAGRIRNPG